MVVVIGTTVIPEVNSDLLGMLSFTVYRIALFTVSVSRK